MNLNGLVITRNSQFSKHISEIILMKIIDARMYYCGLSALRQYKEEMNYNSN